MSFSDSLRPLKEVSLAENRNIFFVLVLFALALWGAYSIYAPFLLSMVVAALLAMATSNLTLEVARRVHSRKLVTVIMVILLTVLILSPIVYIATTGVEYLTRIDKETIRSVFEKARSLADHVPYLNKWADEYLQADKVLPYLKGVSLFLTKFGSKGIGFLKDLGFVIVFYAAIVYYQERFFELVEALIPAGSEESRQMIAEVTSTMEVVFYSIIITAIFEGFLFGIFVSYFGYDGLLLGAVYGFASLIPVVGGVLVWLPLSLYAWGVHGSKEAILIVVYSVGMISIVADTFVKPVIIKAIKEGLLHQTEGMNELVIFFSILAGMSTYGFWGMILGPAITTFLFAATRIYLAYAATGGAVPAEE